MIDSSTEFDLLVLGLSSGDDAHMIDSAYIYSTTAENFSWTEQPRAVDRVPDHVYTGAHAHFDESDPEVAEVVRRVRAGTCTVLYSTGSNYGVHPWPGVAEDGLESDLWVVVTMHPFHKSERDLFFKNLVARMGYVLPRAGKLPRFQIDGVWEGASRRYYKREDTPSAPDTDHAAATSLALFGWEPEVTYGGAYLHAIDVLDSPKSVSVSQPQRVYHRRKDQTGAIVGLARAWHLYWRELPSDFRNNPVRRTMRKHVEHAIGRMWADKPFDSAINVFHAGQTDHRERSARDAEDWMLGNMEFWVHNWSFEALALALVEHDHRSLLDTQLDDYTFCHINLDGTIGDRLSNGADGITEATWDAYQDTHYPAAVRHGVDTLTAPDMTINVAQGETATAQIEPTGGLAPLVFAMVGSSTWLSVDDTGLVTASPDNTVAARTYTGFATVTDALGTAVQVSIEVTVTASADP